MKSAHHADLWGGVQADAGDMLFVAGGHQESCFSTQWRLEEDTALCTLTLTLAVTLTLILILTLAVTLTLTLTPTLTLAPFSLLLRLCLSAVGVALTVHS